MRILVLFGIAILLSACASPPKPLFEDPAFHNSNASRVVMLPLVDQRPPKERADNPEAMQHFADAMSDWMLGVEHQLWLRGYSLVTAKSVETGSRAVPPGPSDALYLQLALTSYDSSMAIRYSASCTGEIRMGASDGPVVWKNAANHAAVGGPVMFFATREGALGACVDKLLFALPER